MAAPSSRVLVSPPRRILTRYVLPITLFAAFTGMVAYATRDALIPVIEVQVVQPVLPSTGLASVAVSEDSNASAQASSEKPQDIPPAMTEGQPIFQAPGWVEPDPFTTLVSSLVTGTISEVHVREGQTVEAGAIVAELDSTNAKIALQKATANLSVRQAELESAQQYWDHPIAVNQTVKTAQAEKARLEAEKVKLQRQFEFQSKLANISKQLGRTGGDSVLAAEKAALEARVAEATVFEIDAQIISQAATLEGAVSNAQLRLEDKSKLALAKAQYESAVAEVDEAKIALKRCQVVAPTSGTVMKLHKTPGAMVSMDVMEGTQIVSMYDPGSLQVRAEVPLADAGKIQIGLPAEVRVDAMPDKIFMGELTRIVHQADVQRNSLQVKVRIFDPLPTLKPEMLARVQFKSSGVPIKPLSEDNNTSAARTPSNVSPSAAGTGLLIPAAVLPEGARSEAKIWLVASDMRAHLQTITLTENTRGTLREVKSGLQPSDKIISSNTEELKEGSRIRIAAPQQEKESTK